MIDLRSDTVTKPTRAMREAMTNADVGDDVLDGDPTVRELEDEVSALLGKEAAMFVSSGTMGNQLAIALMTRPGDEVIVGEGAHVVFYESGAGAALSGVQFAVAGRGGFFDVAEMTERIHAAAYWCPRTSLVALENTHNRAGGRVLGERASTEIANAARERGLGVHLDGARLWNACAATKCAPSTLAYPFDTVSVCFSKGLGAPVGSALCGPKGLIDQARRLRKMWGGGMRQVGILAAGALYALRYHRERIEEDHLHARRFAELISEDASVSLDLASVETNIVNVDLAFEASAELVAARARDVGLRLQATGPRRLRAVMHLDVQPADVPTAAKRLREAIALVRGTTR